MPAVAHCVRAVGVVEFGGPDQLEVLELPVPDVGPGQVRIAVRAAAVNPTDTLLRSGGRRDRLQGAPPPHVPGMDAAGVLEEIGPECATDLVVGHRVMAIVVPHGAHGAYAEQIVVPAESVARMPAGASFAAAATLPMNGLTARRALDLLALEPGQSLAVTGAAGAVGGYAIELAKADRLRVIADAKAADHELVQELGADLVLPRGPGFAERLRRVVETGVDGLIDAALLDHEAVPAVADGGRVATLRGYSGLDERGITFCPVWVREEARSQAKLDRLRQQVEDGQLTLRVARTFPAARAAEAHRLLEAGGTRGRIVLEF